MIINTDIDYALKSWNHKEWLSIIKENIKNIDYLLNNLNLITKIESWYNLKTENLNISDVFHDNILKIQKQFIEKNISTKLIISDEIYQQTNKFSFEIIIKNLVENAFKYSKNNWNIEFYLDEKQLYIKDNWIWIQEENLDKIWDRFWKEDESRSEEKSFWLWLYIVKKIVEIYNWKISVETEKNIWTKFIILFD
jgi:K+-sensing histidine kinase KdpD